MSNVKFCVCGYSGNLILYDDKSAVQVDQKHAGEVSKAIAHYAETGKLNEPLKRWVIGWDNQGRKFRFHAWDGIIDINKSHTQATYFKSEAEAEAVHTALFTDNGNCTGVMQVSVIERRGVLVEW